MSEVVVKRAAEINQFDSAKYKGALVYENVTYFADKIESSICCPDFIQ